MAHHWATMLAEKRELRSDGRLAFHSEKMLEFQSAPHLVRHWDKEKVLKSVPSLESLLGL